MCVPIKTTQQPFGMTKYFSSFFFINVASVHTGEGTVDEYPDISGITTAREAMRKMTEEDKQKIAQQVELFRKEKMTFDSEVAKWDDNGNDIIFLAKHMCMIMMEMTDFTR